MLKSPGRDWQQRARRALFGEVDLPWRVFLTPFWSVMDLSPGEPGKEGWWPLRIDAHHAVIKVPQGSAATDAVLALDVGHDITFIGLCGSTTGTPPGEIVEAGTASAWDGTHGHRRWPNAPIGPEVEIASVPYLATSAIDHERLSSLGLYVDMETAWIYAAANATKTNVRSVLAVSDQNEGGSVFGSRLDDVEAWLAQAWAIASET